MLSSATCKGKGIKQTKKESFKAIQQRKTIQRGNQKAEGGVGKPSFCNRVLHKRVLKIKEALAKLDIIDDPQIELTLLRCCMGFPRFAFAIRSTPPDMVSEAIAFFDQIMDETAEDRFDIAFSDRRKRQWHMPIRMGGVGIPRAEDAAAPAYLANTVDCCDLVREMLGKEDIVPLSNPGVAETWDDFKKAANTKIDLPPNIEELLKQLKLSGNHPGSDDLTSFLRKPGEKTQHFLNSTLQRLRLRELLATMDPRTRAGTPRGGRMTPARNPRSVLF